MSRGDERLRRRAARGDLQARRRLRLLPAWMDETRMALLAECIGRGERESRVTEPGYLVYGEGDESVGSWIRGRVTPYLVGGGSPRIDGILVLRLSLANWCMAAFLNRPWERVGMSLEVCLIDGNDGDDDGDRDVVRCRPFFRDQDVIAWIRERGFMDVPIRYAAVGVDGKVGLACYDCDSAFVDGGVPCRSCGWQTAKPSGSGVLCPRCEGTGLHGDRPLPAGHSGCEPHSACCFCSATGRVDMGTAIRVRRGDVQSGNPPEGRIERLRRRAARGDAEAQRALEHEEEASRPMTPADVENELAAAAYRLGVSLFVVASTVGRLANDVKGGGKGHTLAAARSAGVERTFHFSVEWERRAVAVWVGRDRLPPSGRGVTYDMESEESAVFPVEALLGWLAQSGASSRTLSWHPDIEAARRWQARDRSESPDEA